MNAFNMMAGVLIGSLATTSQYTNYTDKGAWYCGLVVVVILVALVQIIDYADSKK